MTAANISAVGRPVYQVSSATKPISILTTADGQDRTVMLMMRRDHSSRRQKVSTLRRHRRFINQVIIVQQMAAPAVDDSCTQWRSRRLSTEGSGVVRVWYDGALGQLNRRSSMQNACTAANHTQSLSISDYCTPKRELEN